MEKKPLTHTMSGLIMAIVMIAYSMILYFTNSMMNQSMGYLSYLLIIGGVAIIVYQYGKSVDNTASFGKLFTFGLKSIAVTTLIVLIFQVVFNVIFPDIKEKIFEASRTEMIKQGKLPDSQIDTAVNMMKKFFWVGVIGGTIFIYMILGMCGALLGAAITKKQPSTPFTPQS